MSENCYLIQNKSIKWQILFLIWLVFFISPPTTKCNTFFRFCFLNSRPPRCAGNCQYSVGTLLSRDSGVKWLPLLSVETQPVEVKVIHRPKMSCIVFLLALSVPAQRLQKTKQKRWAATSGGRETETHPPIPPPPPSSLPHLTLKLEKPQECNGFCYYPSLPPPSRITRTTK